MDQSKCRAGRWRRFCSDQCRKTYHYQKVLEQRRSRARSPQICPNCGKEFQPEWGTGSQRKFCGDACRNERWKEYHKAHPSEETPAEECAFYGAPLTGKQRGKTYCSRCCYLLEMDQTHVEEICEWCGEKFTDMYTGLDGLTAIIRYHLKPDPCDGSVYVFRDGTGTMLKYLE